MYRTLIAATRGEQIHVIREHEFNGEWYAVNKYLTADISAPPKRAEQWMLAVTRLNQPDPTVQAEYAARHVELFTELEAKYPGLLPAYSNRVQNYVVQGEIADDDYEEMYDRSLNVSEAGDTETILPKEY